MLKLEDIKKDLRVRACIEKSNDYLNSLNYTDHGFRHVNIVAERARYLAKGIGMDEREQELCAIAAYCHDMGNFLKRDGHGRTAAMLFSQFFMDKTDDINGVLSIMQAIVSHDHYPTENMNKIAAVLILADSSDITRDRVNKKSLESIKNDTHDRINYSVIDSDFKLYSKQKDIALKLKIDTEFNGVMEYFEIFSEQITMCRQAANFLGYSFSLSINNFKLS